MFKMIKIIVYIDWCHCRLGESEGHLHQY